MTGMTTRMTQGVTKRTMSPGLVLAFTGWLVLGTGAFAAPHAQDLAVHYHLDLQRDVQIVTDLIVAGSGVREYRHPLSPGSRPEDTKAIDRASGRPLATRLDNGSLVVAFARPLAARAEQRLGIEETASRDTYLRTAATPEPIVTFGGRVAGRVTLVLPAGYVVRSASLPAQYGVEAGRMKVGFIAAGHPADLRLEMSQAPSPASLGTNAGPQGAGGFRAEDERSAVYWLEEPATKRFKLSLELRLTTPGQSHVYSVLRKEDNITNPEALDVDRGVVLPARIISGKEANAIGDAPSPLPDAASVFVADVGYRVPDGGSIRVRVYQSAVDRETYLLDADGSLQWTRFLARLRTRIVLPPGWTLTSVDQPAAIGRDELGRVTLDFLQPGAPSPNAVVTARRTTAAGGAIASGQPVSRE
jgi:hypothetical protein